MSDVLHLQSTHTLNWRLSVMLLNDIIVGSLGPPLVCRFAYQLQSGRRQSGDSEGLVKRGLLSGPDGLELAHVSGLHTDVAVLGVSVVISIWETCPSAGLHVAHLAARHLSGVPDRAARCQPYPLLGAHSSNPVNETLTSSPFASFRTRSRFGSLRYTLCVSSRCLSAALTGPSRSQTQADHPEQAKPGRRGACQHRERRHQCPGRSRHQCPTRGCSCEATPGT